MAARKQRKYPRIRPDDWPRVDGMVRALRAAASEAQSPAAVILQPSILATRERPSAAHHFVMTALNTIRLRGFKTTETDPRGQPMNVTYRMVRYFFRTPAWADVKFGPVETVVRVAVGPSGKVVMVLGEDGE